MATSAAPHIDDTRTPDSAEELAAAQLDSVRRALEVTPEQDAFLAGAAAALRTARHIE
ncbi:hypothetical protein [Rhodococcus erythropolis]|uniref:hypothetical protein n=1 Tax=Rhodococcus erythropolis TaxID=1833 RepID=UPI0008CBB876|nr:hypothetical protein [Rhodococcus erythropolis]OFV77044.1 hypothetical protein RERY_22070 [Rhodococcus erythropolis]